MKSLMRVIGIVLLMISDASWRGSVLKEIYHRAGRSLYPFMWMKDSLMYFLFEEKVPKRTFRNRNASVNHIRCDLKIRCLNTQTVVIKNCGMERQPHSAIDFDRSRTFSSSENSMPSTIGQSELIVSISLFGHRNGRKKGRRNRNAHVNHVSAHLHEHY